MRSSFLIFSLILICILSISSVCAEDSNYSNLDNLNELAISDVGNEDYNLAKLGSSEDLINKINNANVNDVISVDPGIYSISNLNINKNLTISGKGNPKSIIFDGSKTNGILNINNANVFLNNITFINGNTQSNGSAINIINSSVYINHCIFDNNSASENGGAISIVGQLKEPSYLSVKNSHFEYNHADIDGGAIFQEYAYSDISKSQFLNNSASRDGGALAIELFSKTNVTGSIFDFNSAEWAGAIYNWPGVSFVNNSTITNNSAISYGGAFVIASRMEVYNSTIVNNTAGKYGGFLFVCEKLEENPAVAKFKHNVIADNKAKNGTAVYVYRSTSHISNFNDNNWGIKDPVYDPIWDTMFVSHGLVHNPLTWINPIENKTIDNKTNTINKTNKTNKTDNCTRDKNKTKDKNKTDDKNHANGNYNIINKDGAKDSSNGYLENVSKPINMESTGVPYFILLLCLIIPFSLRKFL